MRFPTDLARLLVVDDAASFRGLVSRCLEPHGVGVKGAATGEDGLCLARSFKPDVIILDWVLKGLSGLHFARRLRKDAAINSIPTIMVSSLREPTDAARALEAGADAFLTKDQMQVMLLSYKCRALRRPERGRILVIEDDESAQEFILHVLASQGYEVELAKDGRSGLQAARRARPALILLDLGLPGMNGIEVFKLLGESADTRQIPVLLMTAMADGSRVMDSLVETLHPADFIHKPFGDEELAARVARVLDAPPAGDDAGPSPVLNDLVLERGRIRMDLTTHKVYVQGRLVQLARRRFDLLRILLSHQEDVSIERLLAEGWPEAQDTGAVKKTVQRLRSALGLADDPIVTVGHGYKLIG